MTILDWFTIVSFNIFKKVTIKTAVYLGGSIIRFNIKNLSLKYYIKTAGLLDNNNIIYIKGYFYKSRFKLL